MSLALREQTKVLEELMISRRTVHRFTEEQVPKDLLKYAIEKSLWVPNHKLTFPWAFMILDNKQRSLLAESAVAFKSKDPEFSEVKQNALRDKLNTHGSMVLAFRKKTDESNERLVEEDRAALACSIFAFSLLLQSEGFYTKWSTAKFLRSDEVSKALELDKDQLECGGMIYCGKPVGEIPKAAERPEIGDVLI